MTTRPALTIIGAGSLARTLLAGWTARSTPFRSVTTVSRRASRAAELAPDVTRAFSIEGDRDAIAQSIADADIVLIAVKPWMVPDLLSQIAGQMSPAAVVVSVVAGVRLDTLRSGLGSDHTIVRVLPNTPSQVNSGVAGLVGEGDAGKIDEIRQLFGVLGEVVEVDEDGMDSLTVVTGSAPAFIYLFTEKLADAMTVQGFSVEDADRMARQVLIGSARLLEATGEDPRELRRRVTSPQGVTHHAVEVFEAQGLGELVNLATAAGLQRARELATSSAPV